MNKIAESTFANSDLFYFPSIIFKNILDCINFEDSPRLKFIDEECGNLIVVNDRGELTETITQKKSDLLQ